MVTFEDLKNKREKICVVGLGYVGLPLAVALAKHFDVIGFDINEKRIKELTGSVDKTNEVASDLLKSVNIDYNFDSASISRARFIIVAVPTPVTEDNMPDLNLVEKATELVAEHLQPGSIITYESTVYPGVTEDICVPILEKFSGLKCGTDFKIGYSPERINPGDKEHTINKVTKVVSGMDQESLEVISKVYGTVTDVFGAASIKVAEAAKVIENTQRDLNIALMNELSVIFDKMDISIYDVLSAAGSKWNFLNFKPGLVGGHCIGVDPYYLTYKAQSIGYNPEVILAGRHINDSMPEYLVNKIFEEVEKQKKDLKSLKFVLFGITFKENIPDSRNSKSACIYKNLLKHGVKSQVFDPLADKEDVLHEYGINLTDASLINKADVLIISVAHDEYKKMLAENLEKYLNPNAFIFDIKKILDDKKVKAFGYNYWTL